MGCYQFSDCEGLTEADFFDITRQMEDSKDMNELNTMITSYLQNSPNRTLIFEILNRINSNQKLYSVF